MLTTFLIEHRWITTALFVAVVTVGPTVAWWLFPRPKPAVWLGALSAVPVAVLTLAPASRDIASGCAWEWSLPTFGRVELMANLVLFVPPVLLLAVALRKPLLVLLGASATSALIEGFQALVPALGRSCSTNDWSANSLGALLGTVLAVVVLRLRCRP